MHRAGRFLSVFLSVVLTVGCGPGVPSAPRPAFDGNLDEVLEIKVANHQLDEARVWLWVDGQRERLGSVRGSSSETFFFPMDGIRTVHMEFDLTLGAHCVTTNVSLGPGDQIDATIPSILTTMLAVCRSR